MGCCPTFFGMHFKRTFFFALCSWPCLMQSQWIQLGDQIDEVNLNSLFQSPVALSGNGEVAAIGSQFFNTGTPNAGRSQVVQWDGTAWNAMGNSQDGEEAGDWCGKVVSMNEAGTVYAMSCPGEFNADGEKSGVVRVYEWDGTGWALRGMPIEGPGSGAVTDGGPWPQFGHSLDLSADGNVLAIGAPDESEDATALDEHGLVQVWQWDGEAWSQRGQDLRGVQNMDFGECVVMSQNGDILVVGAPKYGSPTEDLGWVQVYAWDGEEWGAMGDPLLGSVGQELLGMRLALSSNGLTLAVGSPDIGTSNVLGPGLVSVHDWDGTFWAQRGSTLSLEGSGHGFGSSLAMQADGNRLAVGAISASLQPLGFSQEGACHVYDWDGVDWVAVGEPVWGEGQFELAGGVALSADGQVMGIASSAGLTSPGRVRFFAHAQSNGVQDEEGSALRVYPNPAADFLTLSSAHALEAIEVLNTLGQVRLSSRPGGTAQVLDVSSLTPGMYFLRITSAQEGRTEIQRFLKQ